MFRPRVIPLLLLKNKGLVKSVKFKDYKYIGDPMNAVKIFNDKRADELVFLDVTASLENRLIPLDFVENVGDEANMPFAVGGGIRSIEDIRKVLKAGAEKVIINSFASIKPEFIREASEVFGSSTIVVSIDVKKKFIGKEQTYIFSGHKATGIDPLSFAKLMEEMGAGEIIINSIDKDGTMEGYDISLISRVSEAVTIPVVACGGAGNYQHFKDAILQSHASAVAAGSLFVYHGTRRAVLINYPTQVELIDLFLS